MHGGGITSAFNSYDSEISFYIFGFLDFFFFFDFFLIVLSFCCDGNRKREVRGFSFDFWILN